jgi:flagellar biosynthetic protein FliP
MFANMAKKNDIDTANDVPLSILVPAFITSELKTAFQIGFTIFIPFLIIDLVVASILMALGMMMVPPTTIALPFKLMLFVLVDGWQLIIGSLAQSFFS